MQPALNPAQSSAFMCLLPTLDWGNRWMMTVVLPGSPSSVNKLPSTCLRRLPRQHPEELRPHKQQSRLDEDKLNSPLLV